MPQGQNFLLGKGDRLTEEIVHPRRNRGDKSHPYTVARARKDLIPRLRDTVRHIEELPAEACPADYAVCAMALHPTYIAKSYFPHKLFRSLGLQAVGSRPRRLEPRATVRSIGEGPVDTIELFVAGERKAFSAFLNQMDAKIRAKSAMEEIRYFEDIRHFKPGDRLKQPRSDSRDPLMEIVLHLTHPDGIVLSSFQHYLTALGASIDLSRHSEVGGLSFISARVPSAVLSEMERFSFLRVARGMPCLRTIQPILRMASRPDSFACTLPDGGPVNPQARVALFDGGVPPSADLDRWVTAKRAHGVGTAHPDALAHGMAVTSAVLFGSLTHDEVQSVPPAHVDHYQVIDEDTDPGEDSYVVLDRIMGILSQNSYDLVNLSLGPELPVDDDEIDRWTAEFDQHLAQGDTLLTIAAGNGGQHDAQLEYNRIQVPADAVNAVSVGAADSSGPLWRRAPYSSIGPGRSPGIVKPDVVAFGGAADEPFWVLAPRAARLAVPCTGTSFSAPDVLRKAATVRAHYGDTLRPLAIKALLVHRADQNGLDQTEVGWGKVPSSLGELVVCEDGTVTVVYQGQLQPGKYLRAPIPTPAETIPGNVSITATFCFACETDPEHTPSYTRSGLDIQFRPHDQKPSGQYTKTDGFFQPSYMYTPEIDRRCLGHKWETVLHRQKSKRGSSLSNPEFNIHYNARKGGAPHGAARAIPYALIVTLQSRHMLDIYSRTFQRYQTILEVLRPQVSLPVRIATQP
ncbi:MAG: S8 family peptidase [Lentisphaerae bacterium]|nr:S8 family peptidase [Lentisphaerota bacterium]